MDIKIGFDIARKQLVSPDGGTLTLPPVTQGDTLRVVLQGMELLDSGDYRKCALPFGTIKCGIGFIDAPPKEGAWRVSVAGIETADLPFNIGKQALELALNALSSVVTRGGVKVVQSGASNIYAIRWNNAAENTAFVVSQAKLYPKCFTRVIAWALDFGTIFLVKLFQAPVAFTDQFSLPMPPAVERALVRAGTGTRNEVQRISIPVGAVGEFSITWSGLTTAILPVSGLTAAKIAGVLNDLFTDGAERFRVTQPSARYYYVEFVGPLALTEQALMEINMENQPLLETPVGEIPLTGPGVEVALDGKPEVAMAIEVEVINGGKSGTPVQAPITVLNDMIDDAMAIANDPAWLEEQRDPVAWLEHDHSQMFYGERHYVAIVGDGILGEFVYEHNLGTTRLHVTLWENGGTNLRVPDNLYETKALDDNRVQVTFPDAPDENAYLVLITSIGPESYFLGHNHTISEIIGLQEILDSLTAAGNPADFWPNIPVEKLPLNIPWDRIGTGTIPDAKIPSTIPRLNAAGKLDLSTIPLGVPRVDAATGELVYWGVDQDSGEAIRRVLADADGFFDPARFDDFSNIPGFVEAVKKVLSGDGANDLALSFALPSYRELYPGRAPAPTSDDIDAATLPRPGGLLPAIHDATVTDLTIPIPAAGSPYTGNVYLNDSGSDLVLPGVMGRKGSTLKAGEHAACDGRMWYRVSQEGSTTSYHPQDFDRELVLLDVNDAMFPVGSIFTLQLDFVAQILRSETRAQWVFIVETGAFAAAGGCAGTNISGITWDATPVITCPIHLTAIRTPHTFGVRFTRAADEESVPVITGETKLYRGAWADTDTVPAGPGFALRARLARFDTEDSLPDPRGYVFLALNPNKKSLANIV